MNDILLHNRPLGANDPETDFKAEVIAAALLQLDIPAENIFVKRVGINSRARSKDIITLKKEFFEFDEPQLMIETNRESIYDYLPEGIFHPPTLGGLGKQTEDIIDEMKVQRKAEEDAKKFFTPFELAAYYTELAALHTENNIDHKGANDHLLDILAALWPLLDMLDKETAKIFIHLLPYFHSARGNKAWFEQCMSAFLGVPVAISFTANQVDEIENIETLYLSNTRLGIDTLLCGSHADGNRNWQVNIGPVPHEEVQRYVPGNSFNKVLAAVCNYCLPATAVWQLHIITEKQETGFVLPGNEDTSAFLGYNTFL